MRPKRIIAILMVILTVVCSGMTAIAAGVRTGSESSVMNEGGEGAWVQADNGKWWYRYSDEETFGLVKGICVNTTG